MNKKELRTLQSACSKLDQFNDYRMHDYICILMNTVLDFQMQTPVVQRAYEHYINNRRSEIRSHSDLQRLLSKYPNTLKSNTRLAQYLWGTNHWSRVKLLRELVKFFEAENVRGYKSLKKWIDKSTFENIQGKVVVRDKDTGKVIHSIGPVLFEWLRLRLGKDTIKADVHVKRFMEKVLGYTPSSDIIISSLIEVSRNIGVKPRELDAAIWHEMSGY
ncbi:hypothetical protein [Kistimonas asteriae]|uniref:hypothetical protein n=1 Tax=Kistimonas asteriae TaxID=517724 RepID=UPI001BA85623|nr:hypothetical protein [Kistimonas asteriae]